MSDRKNKVKKMKTGMLLMNILALMVCPFVSFSAKASGLNIIRDVEIETILKNWSRPVFEAAGLDPDAINLILVQNDQINAFVAGGSNIFIYTGLISKAEAPGELIGVIAHETGHITGGHLVRSREAMERASYESMIGIILGVGAALVAGNAEAVGAAAAGATNVAQRSYLAHSRVQESSADQAALTYLEKAKINPSGMLSFMRKLKAENYVPASQQSEFLRTHPLTDNRIEALETRVKTSPYISDAFSSHKEEELSRMQAKLVGFIHPEQIVWIYNDQDHSIAADYARAISEYRQYHEEKALELIDSLIEREPQNPYFHELKGQMLVDFGDVAAAIPEYRKSLDILPSAALFRIALGHALIEDSGHDNKAQLQEAIDNLELALQTERRSSRIHRLLATAYGRLGDETRAKLHLAEEAVLQGSYGYAESHAKAILDSEEEGSSVWIKAKDIISFIETVKKG